MPLFLMRGRLDLKNWLLNNLFFVSSSPFLSFSRCPPCKMIKPVYEELSDKYDDVAFGKIDIDENQDAAMEYQISSVPTFVFFDGKNKYGQFSGADKAQLESVIKDLDQA
jgi:thiol-disulfide isomerase/thioredoxin